MVIDIAYNSAVNAWMNRKTLDIHTFYHAFEDETRDLFIVYIHLFILVRFPDKNEMDTVVFVSSNKNSFEKLKMKMELKSKWKIKESKHTRDVTKRPVLINAR